MDAVFDGMLELLIRQDEEPLPIAELLVRMREILPAGIVVPDGANMTAEEARDLC